MEGRLERELQHGREISARAEDVWNWSSAGGQMRAERRASYFVRYGRITKTDKVLEIGAGTGLFSGKVYRKTGASILATDLSEELLTVARNNHPEIEFQVADAMHLDIPVNTFDVVFGSSVLHHLDMDRALAELFRVLKPGGRFVFEEPNMLNPQIFIQKNVPFVKRWLGDSPDETAIVRWRMNGMLRKAGFVNAWSMPVDFLHPATPASLVPAVKKLSNLLQRVPLIREIGGSVFIYAEKPL